MNNHIKIDIDAEVLIDYFKRGYYRGYKEALANVGFELARDLEHMDELADQALNPKKGEAYKKEESNG